MTSDGNHFHYFHENHLTDLKFVPNLPYFGPPRISVTGVPMEAHAAPASP